uniref:Uncharacterized protein n=1 Tax=Rhizophora mucronata TaxID=61149 RepID=A0A2P2QIA8_RHIMU
MQTKNVNKSHFKNHPLKKEPSQPK